MGEVGMRRNSGSGVRGKLSGSYEEVEDEEVKGSAKQPGWDGGLEVVKSLQFVVHLKEMTQIPTQNYAKVQIAFGQGHTYASALLSRRAGLSDILKEGIKKARRLT